MAALSYMELRVPSHKPGHPNALPHGIMALLVKFTHAIAARQGFRHALAFPKAKVGAHPTPGDMVRVFALERAQLDALADVLEKQQFVREHVSIGRIKELPPDYQPRGYVEYRRFRVPNRGSRLEESRAKRMALADRLPHLRLNSASSGHGFSLFVEPIPQREALSGEGAAVFEPDVYGLSVYSRRFALPVLPDDDWPLPVAAGGGGVAA